VQTLRHVLWMGGSPGAGKSSVATRIARRYGLRWYNADTRTWQHCDRALRAGNAAACRWEAMTPQQRWVESTPRQMLEMSLHVERGPMVIDDLRALPHSPLVVAEGSTLPAHALSSGIAERSRAVWLLPTRAFQQTTLTDRAVAPGPMALHLLLGETIEQEAREHGARTLTVDGSRSIDQMVAPVQELFAEALAEGPCAATLAERRGLLREANEAIASQVRGFYGRPWQTAMPRRSCASSSASVETLAATRASSSRSARWLRELPSRRDTVEHGHLLARPHFLTRPSAVSDNVRLVVAVRTRSWSTSQIVRSGVAGRNRALPGRNSNTERLLTGQAARATAPGRRRGS
jgi:hypothetical protein